MLIGTSNLLFYFIKFNFFLCFRCHLCPDFTPVLIEFYKKHAKEKNFEIIFLSFDNDEESFKEYYQDMPWLTLDYDQEDKRDELKDKFNVHGFPTFILLDGESGQIICQNAKIQIQTKDTEGEKFPWKSIE